MRPNKTIFIIAILLLVSVCASAQINRQKYLQNEKQNNLINTDIKKSLHADLITSEKGKDFTFTINPYLWMTGIGGNVGLPGASSYEFNAPFTDLVKNLSAAAMIAGRVKYKSVSLLYDIAYTKLKQDLLVPSGNSEGYLSGNLASKEFVGNFQLAYRIPVNERSIQIDWYGGVRVLSLNNTVNLTNSTSTNTTEKSNTWVDPVIGGYLYVDLDKNWYSYSNLDIGGFGVSSDFTSSFSLGFGYNFNNNWNSSIGIKQLLTTFNKNNFEWRAWQYGFFVSAGYRL